MRAVICSPSPEFSAAVANAAMEAGLTAVCEPSPQEFNSLLYRDAGSLGVLWAIGAASATETCRRIRAADARNLIMVLLEVQSIFPSAAADQRAEVFAAGADDVQDARIDMRELVARLHALCRRERQVMEEYRFLDCRFNPSLGRIEHPGGHIHLTTQEATLFEALVLKGSALLTKQACMDTLYAGRDEAERKIIDVFVCKLRRKVMSATNGIDVIETVWGEGYKFLSEGFRPRLKLARARATV